MELSLMSDEDERSLDEDMLQTCFRSDKSIDPDSIKNDPQIKEKILESYKLTKEEVLEKKEFMNFYDRLKKTWKKDEKDFSSYPSIVTGVTDVLFHNPKGTDSIANDGIVSYMGDSIEADDDFFSAAFGFYDELRELDIKERKFVISSNQSIYQKSYAGNGNELYEMVPIEKAGKDLYSIALKHAKNDPYMALRIMSVYGHDNFNNGLGARCRGIILNRIKPYSDSLLYLNKAIPKISYTEKEVKEGLEIAKDCNASSMTLLERIFCNDGLTFYQADYYHVVVSSFLGCRQERAQKRDRNSKIVSVVFSSYADAEYLEQVRKYKIDRFKEKTSDKESIKSNFQVEDSFFSSNYYKLLLEALNRLEKKSSPILDPRNEMPKDITDRDYRALQAITHRWEFEVNFRVNQHKRGMEFGHEACKDLGPLPKDEEVDNCVELK